MRLKQYITESETLRSDNLSFPKQGKTKSFSLTSRNGYVEVIVSSETPNPTAVSGVRNSIARKKFNTEEEAIKFYDKSIATHLKKGWEKRDRRWNRVHEATKILKIYKNKKDGIESHVAKISLGYSVTLKDTDAGEFAGVSKIFPNEKDAHKYAKTIIEGTESTIKQGDWVEGSATVGWSDEMFRGIFIADAGGLSLIATYDPELRNKKKYMRVQGTKKIDKDKNAPNGLLAFAKKHGMWK